STGAQSVALQGALDFNSHNSLLPVRRLGFLGIGSPNQLEDQQLGSCGEERDPVRHSSGRNSPRKGTWPRQKGYLEAGSSPWRRVTGRPRRLLRPAGGSGALLPPGGPSPQGLRSPRYTPPPYGPYDCPVRSPRFQSGGEGVGRFGVASPPGPHTPRRPYDGRSPQQYQHQPPFKQPLSGGYQRRYSQGSPRTSTPFGRLHGREKRVSNDDVENYYKPSMLDDPWAGLEPVSVTDVDQKFSNDQTTYTDQRLNQTASNGSRSKQKLQIGLNTTTQAVPGSLII
uniref:M-phase specific PLK1 interacting protein n=1 Tax=Anolis carolinensis TaxID=28377 RepID=G1KU61_ANOCA